MIIRVLNPDELADQGVDLKEALQNALAAAGLMATITAGGPLLKLLSVRHGWHGKPLPGRDRYLVSRDWVRLFDLVNDVLDAHQVLAIAQTARVRFRIGSNRRWAFDDDVNRLTSIFELRHDRTFKYGKPSDYTATATSRVIFTEGADLGSMVIRGD